MVELEGLYWGGVRLAVAVLSLLSILRIDPPYLLDRRLHEYCLNVII